MSLRPTSFVVALGLVGPLVSFQAAAATLTLTPDRDNTLFDSPTGSLSNGAGSFLFAGKTGNNLRRRGLVHFDLGALPPGAVVTTVTLQLNVSISASFANTVSLHRALASWGEGTSSSDLVMGGGMGAPSTTNDATWVHRFFPGTAWTAQGGDFSASPSAAASVALDGPYTWSSPAMADDVRAWVANPASNQGWVIVGDEAATGTAKRFGSRENVDPSVRPMLTIDFSTPTRVPLPLGAVVGLGLLLGLAGTRARPHGGA